MPQPSNILAHFTFCGSQRRWMCPLHYSSFWVKWWTRVSQCYHGSRGPVCPSFKWPRSERVPANINFCELPSCFLVPNMHTLLYLSCTWTMLGTFFTYHSSAMDKSWIVSRWFFKTNSTTCTVFTCSWPATERCNLHDGCQPTLELCAPSP